jgi:branched-chain amino acid transport system permease protein
VPAGEPRWVTVLRRGWGVALVLVAAASLPWVSAGNPFLLLFLSTTGIYVIAALGLQLIFGWSGMLLLSQASFVGIGAYAAGLAGAHWHWPLLGQLLAGVVVAVAAGLVIAPIVRLRTMYFAMASFGFGLIISTLMTQLPFTGGINGLGGIPGPAIFGLSLNTPVRQYELSFVLCAGVYLGIRWLTHSRLGLRLKAIRQNEVGARSLGIPVARLQVLAMLLGVGAAGLAGALMAATQGFVSPDDFSSNQSLLLVTMLVVGGIGSLPGAVLGAVALYYASTYVQSTAQYTELVYGAIVVAAMLGLPEGVWGVLTRYLRIAPHRHLRLGTEGGGGADA